METRRQARSRPFLETTARALLEAAPEGIVIVDESGRIVVANPSAEKMFGYTREELIGEHVEMLLPEHLREAHAVAHAAFFSAPRRRAMGSSPDLTARRRDGTAFPVDLSLSAIRTRQGLMAMVLVTDMTERRRVESEFARQQEALHQAEKLATVGSLAAGLAHEINNPIGIISSRIELMLAQPDGPGLPAGVREDLEVVQRNIARVAQIAQRLLTFARQAPRERGPVDLNRVVRETLLLVGQQMARMGIELRAAYDPDLPTLQGSANALQQVLVNLLTNAREALGGPGEVTVTCRWAPGRPGWVQLAVRDSGPGIAPELLPRIFDPFFTTKPNGTGLGLALSYGIVRDHDGTIDVQSAPGQGTTFLLSFHVGEESPAGV